MDINSFVQEDGKITTLMLINGVNVIGKVLVRSFGKVWLSKPFAWVAAPVDGQPGAWRLQMGIYIPGVVAFDMKEPFPFKEEHIMHELAPSDGLVEPYVKATSGIILAGANALPTR
jgi:hypothetical protein